MQRTLNIYNLARVFTLLTGNVTEAARCGNIAQMVRALQKVTGSNPVIPTKCFLLACFFSSYFLGLKWRFSLVFSLKTKRGISSVGRAPALQAGGHQFGSDILHKSGVEQGQLVGLISQRSQVRILSPLLQFYNADWF